MKPELLEPLLLDRALGELSPEVAALLNEHLARDPQAAQRAAELDHALVAARAVTQLDHDVPPPALDSARLRRIAQAERLAPRRAQGLRLAACLVLGAVAGWLARPAPVVAPTIGTTPAPAHAGSTRAFTAASAGLWSRSRIVAKHAGDHPSVHPSESRTPTRSPFAPHASRDDKS